MTEFFPHFTVNFGQFFEAFTDFFIFLFFYFYPTIDDIQRYVFSYLESIFIHFLTIFFLNFRSILTLLPIFVKFYRIFDDLSTGFFSSLANFSSISDIFSWLSINFLQRFRRFQWRFSWYISILTNFLHFLLMFVKFLLDCSCFFFNDFW